MISVTSAEKRRLIKLGPKVTINWGDEIIIKEKDQDKLPTSKCFCNFDGDDNNDDNNNEDDDNDEEEEEEVFEQHEVDRVDEDEDEEDEDEDEDEK